MKKFMTLALCMAAVASMSAQKENVDAAKKLSGNFDKIQEARDLIQKAIADPSTANDAYTYYIGGKLEFDAYDKGKTMGAIKPDDPSANREKMAEELLNGYDLYLKALPLDSVPNEKGQVKPKYAKNIIGTIAGHAGDFFQSGAAMWEAKRYYPEAYNCFLIYAQMPDAAFLGNKAPEIPEVDRAQAFFNAGIAAYSGNAVKDAADAFRNARLHGSEDPNTYIYELASWQAIAQRDSSMNDEAQKRILDVAQAGYDKFGIEQPIFLNNLVNTYVLDGDYDKAISTVNNLLSSNPDNSNLLGLLGFIYDRQDKDDESIDYYRKAAALENCDFETLKNASKKMYRVGATKYGLLNPNDTAGKQAVRDAYFEPALATAKRAKAINGDDSDVDYVIENIEYAIQTYYPAN
ncbi:MAG: tetratricopeptide repeat protein [Muribaculaceae bacterium]|nr:tetratricopeptide repeat protein [Muribaculaceae bacterium]